jgi:hypothetical protein
LLIDRLTGNYDVVLLDCPPFINISCVNALAASDYVIIPVMPSRQATDRVTVLLERLKQFRDNLHTDLRVMGFFANRTKESDLTHDERGRIDTLAERCKQMPVAAPPFETSIRQSVEGRRAEDEWRPLGPGDEFYPAFVRLAAEVESRLPRERLRGEGPDEAGHPQDDHHPVDEPVGVGRPPWADRPAGVVYVHYVPGRPEADPVCTHYGDSAGRHRDGPGRSAARESPE